MKNALLDREGMDVGTAGRTHSKDFCRETNTDGMISQLFRAYFNNKMTLPIFLIQAKTLRPNLSSVEAICRFFDDIYHHMMTSKVQEQYFPVLEWLKSFFKLLPDVTQEQRVQAKEFVRNLYGAVGINLKADI